MKRTNSKCRANTRGLGFAESRERKSLKRLHQKTNFYIRVFSWMLLLFVNTVAMHARRNESTQLICGHQGKQEVPQIVWLEQLNDTLFTLKIPIQVKTMSTNYPEGRLLLMLNKSNKLVASAYNIQEESPLPGDPNDQMHELYSSTNSSSSIGYIPGNSVRETSYYVYPQFIFTREELEYLIAHYKEIHRIVVDTAEADSYWLLYPKSTFGDELKQLMSE